VNDLAHTHLTEQDFLKIEHPTCILLGEDDKMVSLAGNGVGGPVAEKRSR
jgi:hypothetical protein